MVALSPERASASPLAARPHIVDVLIAERAPHLAATPIWPLIKPLLYRLLDYDKARAMADAIAAMSGREALDYVSALLALDVHATGLKRVPKSGRLILISNHPTGVVDGLAVYDAVKRVRSDITIFINADAFRVCPGFTDMFIPVEWMDHKRTRERARQTLQMARAALEAERAIIVFPAGRLAHRRRGVLADPVWASSAVSLARKYDAPIFPLHLSGPSSTLFHLFDRVSSELRDITLFHELLNKHGGHYELTAGTPIPSDALDGDAGEATARLKTYVERDLALDPDRRFT